jgi:hypothetical protein
VERWDSLVQAAIGNIPLACRLLEPDEILDALDEELVLLERLLPDWYSFEKYSQDVPIVSVKQDCVESASSPSQHLG